MSGVNRRDFIKYGLGGAAALVVGSGMPWMTENKAQAGIHVQELKFTITDAIKNMATHNTINSAQCYFWIFKEANLPPECPGPIIFATEGDIIELIVTNALDEPHAFFIPGMVNTGPIAPGATARKFFTVGAGGTYLYFDNLNQPVNRVMGLHGAFIVMPKAPVTTSDGVVHKFTPYSQPTAAVQQLFDDFGSPGRAPWPTLGSNWFPGLAWEERDPATNTYPFRTYIWLLHQASPKLFARVGDFTPGLDYPADQFVNSFLHDAKSPTNTNNENIPALVDALGVVHPAAIPNDVPQYFTISGQSGHFSHNSPYICPNQRIGEPVVIRLLNAGLWSHSMHIHANHQYITWVNGVVMENPIWIDTFTCLPMTVVDYTCPYMRQPDIPNIRGIGRADLGLPAGSLPGGKTWPPNEELNTFIPGAGTPFPVQLSPLCYPMHDHSEPSQTAQGGNYNMGLISGINFIGDRNTAGAMNFPNQPLLHGPGPDSPHGVNGVFPPAVPPPWFA